MKFIQISIIILLLQITICRVWTKNQKILIRRTMDVRLRNHISQYFKEASNTLTSQIKELKNSNQGSKTESSKKKTQLTAFKIEFDDKTAFLHQNMIGLDDFQAADYYDSYLDLIAFLEKKKKKEYYGSIASTYCDKLKAELISEEKLKEVNYTSESKVTESMKTQMKNLANSILNPKTPLSIQKVVPQTAKSNTKNKYAHLSKKFKSDYSSFKKEKVKPKEIVIESLHQTIESAIKPTQVVPQKEMVQQLLSNSEGTPAVTVVIPIDSKSEEKPFEFNKSAIVSEEVLEVLKNNVSQNKKKKKRIIVVEYLCCSECVDDEDLKRYLGTSK